jgi:hypothetical protein
VQTGLAFVGGVNYGFGIAVNSGADTVYLISVSQGDVAFSSANGTSNTVPGVWTWHMVLAKYDTAGNFQWGQVNEAAPNSIPDGVAVDAKDNAYVTGWLEDTTVFYSNNGHNITVTGFSPAQTTFDFPDDCFLAKYDKYGNARWVNLVGGYKCNGSTVAVSTPAKSPWWATSGTSTLDHPEKRRLSSPPSHPARMSLCVMAFSRIHIPGTGLLPLTMPQECCDGYTGLAGTGSRSLLE